MPPRPIYLLFIITPLLAMSQSPVIQGFRAQQVGDDVQLNWFIPQGQSCIDMEVQRSTDSLNFLTVNTVFGLCGTNDSDSPYDYNDRMHEPGSRTYWYRIYASSGTVVSESIRVDYRLFAPGQLVISPNPLIENGTATYTSLSGENLILNWYNSQGQSIRSTQPDTPGQFALMKEGLSPGMYFLQVVSENGEIRDTKRIWVR